MNKLLFKPVKSPKMHRPENQSMGILDDHAVRKSVETQELRLSDLWHVYGGFQLQVTSIACTKDVWSHVTNGSHNLWTALEAEGFSMVADEMIVENSAHYCGQVTLSISGLNGKDYFIRVFNVTQNRQEGYIIGGTTTGADNYMPLSLPIYVEAHAGDHLRLQVVNITDSQPVSVRSAVFWMKYLHEQE